MSTEHERAGGSTAAVPSARPTVPLQVWVDPEIVRLVDEVVTGMRSSAALCQFPGGCTRPQGHDPRTGRPSKYCELPDKNTEGHQAGPVHNKVAAHRARKRQERAAATSPTRGDQDRYTMRRFLEDALTEAAASIEWRHNGGKRWEGSDRLDRSGIDPRTRETGETDLLQSWIAPEVRRRTFAVVNALKASDTQYTMREHLEAAVRQHAARTALSHHDGQPWPALERPRRGSPPE